MRGPAVSDLEFNVLDNEYEFLVDYFKHLTHFRLSLRIEPVDDPQLIECIVGNR